MGKSLNFLGFIVIGLGASVQAQAPLFPLPYDEKEAYIMIREGALDSTLWEMVRPFYEQPLLVPLGELRMLIDIFPGSLPSVPANAGELRSYEPWNGPDIERFFRDFPVLLNFAPILCFETARSPYRARVGTAIQKYKKNDPAIVSSLASRPAATVRFDGRARFEAASARWVRRTVDASTPGAGRLTLGNFSLNFDRGLFYGYFPSAVSDTDARLNWRYAESNTWNGMLYESPEAGHASAAAFIHERKNETVYGARLKVRDIGRFHFSAGASRLMLPAAADRSGELSFAHAEVDFSNEHWNAGAIGGCELAHGTSVPIILYGNHSSRGAGPLGNARVDVLFARIPAGSCAVRGALFHECVEKTDKADSIEVDRSLVKTTCRVPLSSRMISDCGAAYYYSIGHPAAEAFAAVSGKAWIDYSLRYTFRPVIDRSSPYHCITMSACRAATRSISCRAYCRYVDKDESYRSVLLRLTADIRAEQSLEFSPFAAVYTAGDGDREFSLGFSQTLRLFAKTWAEFKAEVPVIKTFQDQWMLDAKAFFYL